MSGTNAEKAEQAEKAENAQYIDSIIAIIKKNSETELTTHMDDFVDRIITDPHKQTYKILYNAIFIFLSGGSPVDAEETEETDAVKTNIINHLEIIKNHQIEIPPKNKMLLKQYLKEDSKFVLAFYIINYNYKL